MNCPGILVLKTNKQTNRHNRYISRLSFLFCWVTHLSLIITLSWLLWRLIESFESHIKYPSTSLFFKTVWLTKTDYSCYCISIYVLGSTYEFIPKSCWDRGCTEPIDSIDQFGKHRHLNNAKFSSPWIWYLHAPFPGWDLY